MLSFSESLSRGSTFTTMLGWKILFWWIFDAVVVMRHSRSCLVVHSGVLKNGGRNIMLGDSSVPLRCECTNLSLLSRSGLVGILVFRYKWKLVMVRKVFSLYTRLSNRPFYNWSLQEGRKVSRVHEAICTCRIISRSIHIRKQYSRTNTLLQPITDTHQRYHIRLLSLVTEPDPAKTEIVQSHGSS